MTVSRSRCRRLVALLACALALAGCRLDVGGELAVERDGSGTVGVVLSLDPEAVARLDELALDPFAELSAAAVDADGWQVTRAGSEDGGSQVRLTHAAGDPQALTDAFRDLVAGLSDDDPALVVDLDLVVEGGGAARLDGTAGLRPPATAGALQDGEPIGPSGEELAALVDEAVTATLQVRLPGPVVEHDADEVVGGGLFVTSPAQTLTWDVPVGDVRTVTARSDAPPVLTLPVIAGVAVASLVLVGVVIWWWRRRG
ncbi:hypothetical protein [Egicoccus sp. AB-alg2]|uniref:hypothetical protein n=1 Tax=Egicoccus sp. AB-alg2 TaxID=3242693 RepID=UPI00359E9828